MGRRRQPQQSTLSVRISQQLRDFVERARVALANGRGERLSLSEVAKTLLEEAQHAPLDERLQVPSLLMDPTGTLLAIRSKWERQAVLSPAEWVVLTRFIEVACEGRGEDTALPKREAFLELLKALQALLKLRMKQMCSRDSYYLQKLLPSQLEEDGKDPRATNVDALVESLIAQLTEPGSHVVPIYVGRVLHGAVRCEQYPSALALHGTLLPFLPTFFRLAARGHWLQERRPLRPPQTLPSIGETPRHDQFFAPVPVCGGDFHLSIMLTSEGELAMALNMNNRDALFCLEPYPQIREFAALLEQLPQTDYWKGVNFVGYPNSHRDGESVRRLYFRHKGTVFGFSPQEWDALKQAFRQILGSPELVSALAELHLQYGEA